MLLYIFMAEDRIFKSTSLDHQEFALRRTRFLDEEILFKTGFGQHGITALNLLLQMYRVFIFKLYLQKDKDKAKKFVDDIDALRKELYVYVKTHPKPGAGEPNYLGNDDFKAIDDRFDGIIAEFYEIQIECGV